jgi:arsenite methyltransferase
MNKVNYGFDAPDIMRNLIIFGILVPLIGLLIPYFTENIILKYISFLIIFIGITLLILGSSMYFYGIKGKFLMRDFLLEKIDWKGDEMVLDIGAGTGLLMNGAAKFLTTGKSIGIDIWRAEDLSDNTLQNALKNAEIEGVSDKIEIKTEDARTLSFPDNSFDVVLSMFCIHNIDDKKEQEKACFEIARVLKPNGTALIGDYIPTHDYARYFEKAGLKVVSSKNYISTAYTLMWMVEATKY